MHTTERKIAAIMREPRVTPPRSLDGFRVFHGEFEDRGQSPRLPLRTMALLVVFAGSGALAVLELVKWTDQRGSLAPPAVLAQAPAEAPREVSSGSTAPAAAAQPAEVNPAEVRKADKPRGVSENDAAIAPKPAGNSTTRNPDPARAQPLRPPSPESSRTPPSSPAMSVPPAPDKPLALPGDVAPMILPGPLPPPITEDPKGAPKE